MSEDATLRDVTVSPNPADAAEPKEPAKPADAKPPEVIDPSVGEAAELGRILLDSGVTKDKINDILQAPQALSNLRYLIANDPQQFLRLLEQTDSKTAENFHSKLADLYVDRYASKGAKPADNGKAPDSALIGEVAALREKVTGFETREQQRQNAAALASTQQRYNARVDDFFSQDGVKALNLTPSEQRGMRALLDSQLAQDPNAVQRVSNGNFVDVAPRFKSIIEGWAADRKSAAEAERKQRDNVQAGANFTFPGGPNPLEIPAAVSDSWEATEDALAKALSQAR